MKTIYRISNLQHAHAKGFTLLELIVVVLIISVLATFLMPRLIGVQHDALRSKAKAIMGSIRTASTLARSRCELDLAMPKEHLPKVNCQNKPPQVLMDGHAVDIVNHFPAPTATGIDVAADIQLEHSELTVDGPECPAGARCFDVVGGEIPNCRIIYYPASMVENQLVSPEIGIKLSGC